MKLLRFLVIVLLFALVGCGSIAALIASPTPTPATPASQIILTPDQSAVRVGEVITVQIMAVNLGMPAFTLNLNDLRYTVGWGDRILEVAATAPPPPFEILSTGEEIQAGQIRLRAVRPGEATLIVSANGEASAIDPNSGQGVWYWSNASASLDLSVNP